ncbi:MAG: hypothetical protein NVS4B3_23190 [Gemmatimonadaceae bacterium]
MTALWASDAIADWHDALDSYAGVIAAQGVARLPDLDQWYREELPTAVTNRRPAHLTLAELVRLTEWKMARGVWRARNLALVRGNAPNQVVQTTAAALALAPDPTAPIAAIAELAGVGPATASAVAATADSALYPFFDELVAAQIPGSGKLSYTLPFYARYAAAMRARAVRIGHRWTPVMVERALWAHVGGKAGTR